MIRVRPRPILGVVLGNFGLWGIVAGCFWAPILLPFVFLTGVGVGIVLATLDED